MLSSQSPVPRTRLGSAEKVLSLNDELYVLWITRTAVWPLCPPSQFLAQKAHHSSPRLPGPARSSAPAARESDKSEVLPSQGPTHLLLLQTSHSSTLRNLRRPRGQAEPLPPARALPGTPKDPTPPAQGCPKICLCGCRESWAVDFFIYDQTL